MHSKVRLLMATPMYICGRLPAKTQPIQKQALEMQVTASVEQMTAEFDFLANSVSLGVVGGVGGSLTLLSILATQGPSGTPEKIGRSSS